MEVNSNTSVLENSPEQVQKNKQFLPIPLACVPPENLNGIKSYLATKSGFSLYNNTGNEINSKDYRRLIESGVKFMYISTDDYQQYYNAIEKSIKDIASSRDIEIEQKCEIVQSTSTALANEVCNTELSDSIVAKSENVSTAAIKVILSDPEAFQHLVNFSGGDDNTTSHISNVSNLLVAFACNVGIKYHQFLKDLGAAGMFHDIGKRLVPDEILNHDGTIETNVKISQQDHVVLGMQYLKKCTSLPEELIEIISHHHEKYDGSGYPFGLKEDEISITGRMLAIVNEYEKITAKLDSGDEKADAKQALVKLRKMTPEYFDPTVLEAFVNFVRRSILCQEVAPDKDSHKYILRKISRENSIYANPSGRVYQRSYFRSQGFLSNMKKCNNSWELNNKKQVVAYNMSQGGLGILSMFEFEPNTLMHVIIKNPQTKNDLVYIANVVRCMDHTDGWYTIGMQFLRTIPDDEVQTVASQLS